ncbi:DUF922 domain-containing protein [Pedobacter aquatilis]|uniref:DUF922 domain-containing protein n=1 Tax=Pedobacter aquatilis TaxID=351343 RepID=UPI0025B428AC|nr:DUF922 domain-containing protein [Pedobacter aquatilis]MDN3588704.1 DUF922 domain-containing protein [Pedobacter aquatilis]
MKNLVLFIIIAVSLPLISFKQDFPEPVQLNFETYFKGKPDENSPYFALTSMTWKYSYESTIYRNRVVINLKNEVAIDKNRSWVKWDKINNEETKANLLHHEQGHVNIHYILQLESDRVLKNRNYSVKNFKNQISDLANQISKYYDTMQRNYDDETEHGINRKMQARWDKIIEDKIAEAKAATLADSRK